MTSEMLDEVTVSAAVDYSLVEQALQGSLNFESQLHSYLTKSLTGDNKRYEYIEANKWAYYWVIKPIHISFFKTE